MPPPYGAGNTDDEPLDPAFRLGPPAGRLGQRRQRDGGRGANRGDRCRHASGRCRRAPHGGVAGLEQRSQPRLPAGDRRSDRVQGRRPRLVLDLARHDVPLSRRHRSGRGRGGRRAGLRRDARGRVHAGGGVPLPAPRFKRGRVRRYRRDGWPGRCCRRGNRDRADAAAGVLCACRLRWRAAHGGATPVHLQPRPVRAASCIVRARDGNAPRHGARRRTTQSARGGRIGAARARAAAAPRPVSSAHRRAAAGSG